jgi:hypothetical protein
MAEDFEDADSFQQWVLTRPPPDIYYSHVRQLQENGMPARLHVIREEYFAAIYLEPMIGWTWLSTTEATRTELARGWRPHISISKQTVDSELWERIVARSTLLWST